MTVGFHVFKLWTKADYGGSMPDLNLLLYRTADVLVMLMMAFSWITLMALFLEFSKDDSVLQNSFYYFFSVICGIDLVFTFVYFLTNETNHLIGLNGILENFQDWHFFYVVFVWQLFTAVNRATAISTPWQHRLFWKCQQVVVAFLIAAVLPFIVRLVAVDSQCRFDQRNSRCLQSHLQNRVIIVFFGAICTFFNVVIVVVAVILAKKKGHWTMIQAERPMMLHSLLAATFTFVFVVSQTILIVLHQCYSIFVCNQFELISDILFLVCHLVPLYSLFFISRQFRNTFLDLVKSVPSLAKKRWNLWKKSKSVENRVVTIM